MKYIVTEDELGVQEIFTFPSRINHDAMMLNLEGIRNQMCGQWQRVFREPVSAGFIGSNGQCYGGSETLGLLSRPEEDTALWRTQT
jgi:hypothetical protein